MRLDQQWILARSLHRFGEQCPVFTFELRVGSGISAASPFPLNSGKERSELCGSESGKKAVPTLRYHQVGLTSLRLFLRMIDPNLFLAKEKSAVAINSTALNRRSVLEKELATKLPGARIKR
jgi:hypothetical protein